MKHLLEIPFLLDIDDGESVVRFVGRKLNQKNNLFDGINNGFNHELIVG